MDEEAKNNLLRTAEVVPFILRGWWLRELEPQDHLDLNANLETTGPSWSTYTDPLCDMGSIDFAYEN